MTDSVAKKILLALRSRLEMITLANGYQTDAGRNVMIGQRLADHRADILPAIRVMRSNEPTIQLQGRRRDLTFAASVECFVLADQDNPGLALEDVIADVKKALFLADDRYLQDVVSGKCLLHTELSLDVIALAPVEPGSRVESAVMAVSGAFPELYGDPYTIV